MPLVKLPINTGLIAAVDEVGLVTHGASMVNVYIDELGNINRWPGLVEVCDLGTSAGVDGLYWWQNAGVMLAVSNGRLWKITASDGTRTEISFDSGQFAVTGAPVSFAAHGDDVYAANGAEVYRIQASANAAPLADADAPTGVTHVGFLDRYLLANDGGTGNFYSSDVNAPTAWSGYYNEAEGAPDDLTAIIVANREIAAIGPQSLEFFYNDGTSPFSRLAQGFVQRGTIAPYSLVFCVSQNTLVWMDEYRQVVMLQGRTPVPLSLTMTKYIQGFSTVTDAQGSYIEALGRPYYILRFPTEQKCLVFDFTAKNWYELGSWNSISASYEAYRGACYAFSPAWNKTFVGDRANGKIYYLSDSTYTEGGGTLRSLIRTGHYNHGSEAVRKFSNALYFRLKRTNVVSADGTPDLMVRYRDNGRTAWSTEQTVSLQQVGNTEFRAKLARLGSYYSRQWEFVLSDAYPLCLVSIEEDVDIDAV